MPKKLKIAIIGGGSPNWTKRLVKDLLLTPASSDALVVLYDIDKRAAQLNVAFLSKLAAQLKVGAKFVASDQPRSLQGSNYIIITVSTGGFESMGHDLKIPEKYGIYQTVGDTSGPGGWARAIRNFTPFIEMANIIRKYAPDSVVLNYTNPMATLTDILSRTLSNPVVGLCHGLFENLALIKHYCKIEDENEISIRYAGINHFFWCDKVTVKGRDILQEFRDSGKNLNQILAATFKDTAGYGSHRAVADELFRLTNVLPYLGDRHTCEFFPWYITDLKRIKKYGLRRTTVRDRVTQHQRFRSDLRKMIAGSIAKDYFKRSRETAADIIEAHHSGKAFIDVGNVPNIGQITNLPLGTVVETAVRVDQNGFTPIAYGALPESVLPYVEPYAHVYKQTVDACFEGDRKKALRALREDPVCANLTTPDVFAMGNQLLNRHRKWIGCF